MLAAERSPAVYVGLLGFQGSSRTPVSVRSIRDGGWLEHGSKRPTCAHMIRQIKPSVAAASWSSQRPSESASGLFPMTCGLEADRPWQANQWHCRLAHRFRLSVSSSIVFAITINRPFEFEAAIHPAGDRHFTSRTQKPRKTNHCRVLLPFFEAEIRLLPRNQPQPRSDKRP